VNLFLKIGKCSYQCSTTKRHCWWQSYALVRR